MKNKLKNKTLVLLLIIPILLFSCSKDWLNEKPGKYLVVPETLKDYQAILDAENTINQISNNSTLAGSPNIYVADDDVGQLQEFEMEMYTWQKIIHYSEGGQNFDWNYFFSIIESANLVLEGLDKLGTTSEEINQIEGQARFIRAFGYYHLAQAFCKQYVQQTASSDLGLPLRKNPDVNQKMKRSTLQQTYDFIIADLEFASNTLPASPKYFTRGSKLSAMAMLAKVNLIKQDYSKAGLYADSVLKIKPDLIDFNNQTIVNNTNTYKFNAQGLGNNEIIWYAWSRIGYFETSYLGGIIQVDHSFYNTYNSNDLRKEYFYGSSNDGRINFVGSYTGGNAFFQGISNNEMYFIRSECNARLGKIEASKTDLNYLLSKRFKTGTAPLITENNQDTLLSVILEHRTKEFPRTSNIWWEDVRRLNLDPRFQNTLTRLVNGKGYQLSPNDSRYVLPIPDMEIKLSGLEQNER